MKYFWSLFLFVSISCMGQKKLPFVPLEASLDDTTLTNFSAIDEWVKDKELIGVGESTHGTSEFTTLRHHLFAYLVEQHQFNTFFLEADYGACFLANQYIHGRSDSLKKAMREIRLWPWITEEMAKLIEWMRTYNTTHQNKLNIVGCDMQLFVDDKNVFERVGTTDPAFNFDMDLTDTAAIRQQKNEWDKYKAALRMTDQNHLNQTITSIDQTFTYKLTPGRKPNFRDSCMALNMLTYLNNNPSAKGFYFAHNWHVSKTNRKNGAFGDFTRTAGTFLAEKLGKHYFAIAQDFLTGSFNAITFEKDAYQMKAFSFKRSKRGAISRLLPKEQQLGFIPADQIPQIEKRIMNFVGAVYGKSKSGYKIYRYRPIKKDSFDAFILFRQPVHATALITRQSAGDN